MTIPKKVSLCLRVCAAGICWFGASLGVASEPLRPDAAELEQYKKIQLMQKQESERNLQDLIAHKDKIVGLEAIIADGTDEHVYSRFGHAMLRFVAEGDLWTSDLSVSFLADIDSPYVDLKKGVFGGYAASVFVAPMGKTWDQYVQEERRPLLRYIIPLESRQLGRILATLEHWVRHPDSIGQYKFFTRNCASLLTRLLDESGFGFNPFTPVVPSRMGNWLKLSWLSPFPPLKVENPFAFLPKAAKALGVSEDDLLAAKQWPENAAERLLQNLSEKEIKLLYRTVKDMPFHTSMELAAKVNYRSGSTFDQVMGIRPVPPSLYQLCASESCFRRLEQDQKTLLSVAERQKNRDELVFILNNTDFDFEIQEAKASQGAPEQQGALEYNVLKFPSREEAYQKRAYLQKLIEISN